MRGVPRDFGKGVGYYRSSIGAAECTKQVAGQDCESNRNLAKD